MTIKFPTTFSDEEEKNTNNMVYQFTKKISSLPYLPSIYGWNVGKGVLGTWTEPPA